jgi:hypothetical protein
MAAAEVAQARLRRFFLCLRRFRDSAALGGGASAQVLHFVRRPQPGLWPLSAMERYRMAIVDANLRAPPASVARSRHPLGGDG